METPIEYDMPGVNQLALGAETGLTWESAIQCQLQQDPDVLLVSEVVSPQVASIIVRVALSGHVMLMAFHATTSRGVLRRLIAAGIERGMIAESLVGVIAQRLLRRLCPDCRVPDPDPAATWGPSPLPDGPWYKPVGCDSCHQMGYRGRTAIYETLEPTSTLLEKLKSAEDTDDSLLQDDPNEASGLLADALKKASLGVTSLEEIRRELCH